MRICPKCGAANDDDSTSFCVSCGASYDTDAHEASGKNASALKTWLIICGVALAVLVVLDIILPYPAQAYLVLGSAAGIIMMLVLLVASLVSGWNKYPYLLGLAVFIILPAVAYLAFPEDELKSDSSAIYSILTTSESASPSAASALSLSSLPSASSLPSVSSLPSASPSPSPSAAPSASPSPSPSPSAAVSPSSSTSPSPSTSPSSTPAVSPSPSPTPSPTPSEAASPSESAAPSPSPEPSPSPSPSEAAAIAPSPEPSSKPAGTVVKVTALELAARYAENELAADRDYKDKLVQVSGVFSSLSVEAGQIKVMLGDTICCYFDYAYADQLIDLHAGDRIVIQGICAGRSETVRIDQCMPVE